MSNILGNMPPAFGSGIRGVVPAPTASDVSAQNILRADGTWGAGPSGTLPSQTGNSGKLLTTDGTNASWASSLSNFTLGDLTLGTNGPSVKSSLDARAARQGLVFDGTNFASLSGPVLGTGDFTVIAWINHAAVTRKEILLRGSNLNANTFLMGIETNGNLSVCSAALGIDTGIKIDTGKMQMIAAVRSSGTLTPYNNGIAGTPYSLANDFSEIIRGLGEYAGGYSNWTGFASVLIYNRALSASEVVSLFEAGVPSGADYNIPTAATNTSLSTQNPSSPEFSYDVLDGLSATGFHLVKASGHSRVQLNPTFAGGSTFRAGTKFLLTFTLSGTGTPTVGLLRSSVGYITNYVTSTTGTNSIVLTAAYALTNGSQPAYFIFDADGAVNYTVSNISVTPLGLLLAPDAGQAGGGTTWYDTSGNAANITLPASGVSWNVPTSGKYGGSLNAASGFYVSGSTVSPNNVACVDTSFQTTYGKISAINRGVGNFPLSLNPEGGNIWINKSADSANGALQLATHTTSAGGIGFGTNISLFSASQNILQLATTSGAAEFRLYNGSGNRFSMYYGYPYSPELYAADALAIRSSQSLTLKSADTTALTLDSSQNAVFAGSVGLGATAQSGFKLDVSGLSILRGDLYMGATKDIRLGNAYQAAVVVPTGYVTIKDSTGTTYKVCVLL